MANIENAAWGWNPIIDRMDADHCRKLIAFGVFTLARLGWSDTDIRAITRKAA